MQTISSNNETVPVVVIPQAVTVKPTTPTQKPAWMVKMIQRQQQLNKKYEFAHGQFAAAYNDFLAAIDEINVEHGTDFSFQQAVTEYQGYFANDVPDEVEDDED